MGSKDALIPKLVDIGALKFGDFVLKSGISSPIYVDLRVIIHYPQIVKELSSLLWDLKSKKKLETDVLCGVPYTALPIASVISVLQDVPLVMKRKEAKNYGTKKMVEGIVGENQRCLIVEDIVSSGSSVIETATVLRQEGLVVTDCIVVLNRCQGAQENLKNQGIALHSLFDLDSVIPVLLETNVITEEMHGKLIKYFKDNSFITIKDPGMTEVIKHPLTMKLFSVIQSKQSNLCVAVDVQRSDKLLSLAETLGPHICMLKTHIDILEDFTIEMTKKLQAIANRHNFLIFEDRKFADIGNTVKYQYANGMYKINQWADLVTVHGIPGDGIINAMKAVSSDKERGCVIVAEMSSKGALTSSDYVKQCIEMAKRNSNFVVGFITQHQLTESFNFLHMCPGVSLESTSDGLGQQYKTPERAVLECGADVIVVGRGITESNDVVKTAIEYKSRAFEAYKSRCSC